MKLFLRQLHGWVGIISAIFLFGLAVTGIYLSYPNLFESRAVYTEPFKDHPHNIISLKEGMILATEHGLYRSQDQGQTFKEMPFPYSASAILTLIQVKDQVYVALDSGLLFRKIWSCTSNEGRIKNSTNF